LLKKAQTKVNVGLVSGAALNQLEEQLGDGKPILVS